jgi:hypothetical protein
MINLLSILIISTLNFEFVLSYTPFSIIFNFYYMFKNWVMTKIKSN